MKKKYLLLKFKKINFFYLNKLINLNKLIILSFLLFITLLLSSCQTNNPSLINNYHIGTKGIIVNFLTDNHLKKIEVGENEAIPLLIDIKNQGAHNVDLNDIFFYFSFDPLYLNLNDFNENTLFNILKSNNLIEENTNNPVNNIFFGKSLAFPDGYEYEIPFFYFHSKKIPGERASVNTKIVLRYCYPYNSFLSTEVCLDSDQFIKSGRDQGCKAKPLHFSSQGGPVGVTFIESKYSFIQGIDGSPILKPYFKIKIRNLGKGIIISPYLNKDLKCDESKYDISEQSKVRIKASLSNIPLICNPELVPIINNKEGVTICTIPDNADPNKLKPLYNYNTFLTINLSYLYQDSDTVEVNINNNLFENDISIDDIYNGAMKEYDVYFRDKNGNIVYKNDKPLTFCEYYASHPDEAPQNIKDHLRKEDIKKLSCSCDLSDCSRLGPGYCYYKYCPPGTYCCVKK